MSSIRRTTAVALIGAAALVGGSAAPAVAGAASGRPLTATLTGASEVPGPGDADGTGSARVTINVGQKRLCYTIKVAGIVLPAAAAHVHDADAGKSGDVVVALSAPGADGTATGCATVTRALLKEILHDPAGYYVNVHNSVFPGGALRGQLG